MLDESRNCGANGHFRGAVKSLIAQCPTTKIAVAKPGHSDAYAQLPLIPSHRSYATITLGDPRSRQWCAPLPNTRLFAGTGPVIQCNRLGRAIATAWRLAFCISLTRFCAWQPPGDWRLYFDDFGPIAPMSQIEDALLIPAESNNISGVAPELSTSERS